MVACWEPGLSYHPGDVVEYNGDRYRNIQGHTSQSDWTPSVTPALWGRIPHEEHGHDNDCNDHHQQQQQQQHYDQPPPQQQQGYAPQQPAPEKPWDQHTGTTVDIPHQEQKKNWWDLPDDRKKQLEVGGGLLAGVAALGAGFYAYHEHEKNDDKKKANVWALQNWLQEAKQRTEAFHQHGPRGPLTWILVEGHNIPQNAILGGDEGGKPLYICRAFCDGGVQIGKAGTHLTRGAVYGYCNKSIEVGQYEILVGDQRAIRWVPSGGKLRVDQLGASLVEGGRENDGTPIYIAQADHYGQQPGKASTKLDGAYVVYGNKEERVKEYTVLCYA